MPIKPLRPLRYTRLTARVPLTRGFEAVTDADDAHLVDAWNWFARTKSHGSCNTYAVRTCYESGRQATVQMHTHILPAKPGFVVDHIDGDTLNNRRANLRYATPSQNNVNRSLLRPKYAAPRGTMPTASGRWVARIRQQGKCLHLGTFDTAEEAHAAYAKAALRYHGPFARLA